MQEKILLKDRLNRKHEDKSQQKRPVILVSDNFVDEIQNLMMEHVSYTDTIRPSKIYIYSTTAIGTNIFTVIADVNSYKRGISELAKYDVLMASSSLHYELIFGKYY